VELALRQFVGAAIGSDGLPDPTDTAPATREFPHEVAPRGDDSGGILADLAHVDERHLSHVRTESAPEKIDLARSTTTRTDSPASMPTRMNGKVPETNPWAPR
jgi:hypothetical protein